jgi:exodeoxyribonuclease-3
VNYDIDTEGHDTEGRAITLEYDGYYLVTEYTPNAQDGLARIDYRMEWEDAKRAYLSKLDAKKPIILCGDLNVAHNEIDLKHPKPNRGNAGFSDQERGKFGELLDAGFVDSFRHLYPDRESAYTWWSYRANARANNVGWRIDYFIVSDRLKDRIKDVRILDSVMGSDHCPVRIDIDL